MIRRDDAPMDIFCCYAHLQNPTTQQPHCEALTVINHTVSVIFSVELAMKAGTMPVECKRVNNIFLETLGCPPPRMPVAN